MAKKSLDLPLTGDDIIDDRFSFIGDPVSKQNVTTYARYLLFNYSLIQEYEIPSLILYSCYKDIIIYCGQIAEALCHYFIRECVHRKIFSAEQLLEEAWKSDGRSTSTLNFEDGISCIKYRACIVIEKKVPAEFKQNTKFNELIRACQRSGLFTKAFIKRLQDLQTKRNKIHIGGLDSVDDTYTEEDLNNTFRDLGLIIKDIKSLCEDRFVDEEES